MEEILKYLPSVAGGGRSDSLVGTHGGESKLSR